MNPAKSDFWEAENRIHKLHRGEYDAILHVVGAPLEEKMSKRKNEELRTKEEIVKAVHVTKDGSPRKIGTTTKGNKEYYWTKVDGKPMLGNTYEGLIEKLYYHYGGDALRHAHSVEYYFNCFVREYEESIGSKHKTARNFKADFSRFVSRELADMDVRDVTPQYLDRYCKKLIVDNSLLVSAFKNFKTLLNHMFGQAIKGGIIFYNPAKAVNNKECYALCDQSVSSAFDYDDVLITDEEYAAVEREARHRYEYSRMYGEKHFYCYDLMIGLHNELGCRPGELTALKWGDCKGNLLHIHGQVDSSKSYKPTTKNERGVSKGGRYFPLTPKARQILDELRQRQKQCEINSEYLFCIPNGEHMVPEAYERFVKNVFAAAGVIGKTSYTFRRTVNNRMEEAGFTPSERAFLLGHTPETNIRFYTNPRKNAVLKKFEERFCTGLPVVYPKNTIFIQQKIPETLMFQGFFVK